MQQIPAPQKTKAMHVIERRLKEPLEVYLHRRYILDGLTTVQIGDELGLNNSTVSKWLGLAGIEARFPGQRALAPEAVAS